MSTPAQAPETSHSHRQVIRVAAVAALGGLLFGYDSAVINGAVDAIDMKFDIHGYMSGFTVASALLGSAVGAMFAGRAADHFGRLPVMKVAALTFLISAVGSAFAPWLVLLIIFRLIGGFGVGMASVIAPAYIAEIAPAAIRGRLASMQQLAIVTGIFASQLVNYVLQQIAGSSSDVLWLGAEAWRWMFLVMALPAILYGVMAFTIPESPRFLISSGHPDEAREILVGLQGQAHVDATLERITKSLENEPRARWRDLRAPSGGLYPIVWIGLILSVLQQFVGINVIFYYSNTLWQAVGFSESNSFLISMITSIVNILTTFIAIAFVDKVGRRLLLLIGSSGMVVSLAVLASMFATATVGSSGDPTLGDVAGIVALIAANVFVIAFGMSWGPVVWVLLGELFPNKIRAVALALAAGGQWIANWVVTVTFPGLTNTSLQLPYWIYAGFALVSLIFVARYVKETKGMELEDM